MVTAVPGLGVIQLDVTGVYGLVRCTQLNMFLEDKGVLVSLP